MQQTSGSEAHRSIPACAGEPMGISLWRRRPWVYPRVCGGTRFSKAGQQSDEGLSPRVRGNLHCNLCYHGCNRSIPACAGEPFAKSIGPTVDWVYPRVCGGTLTDLAHLPWTGGLSPRVRGNPRQSLNAQNNRGSIPACAGEPRRMWRNRRTSWVYPRVCGGTRTWSARTWSAPRSIPACAGEPEL